MTARIQMMTGLAALVLTAGASPARADGQVTLINVNPQTPGALVSDLVYGSNDFFFGNHDSALAYPVVRFGGNHTSRYNWEANAWNAGKDWFYLNVPLPYTAAAVPSNPPLSYTDRLLLRQAAGGRSTIITVPMSGWVAKDRQPAWGYSVRKYGRQQHTEADQSHGDAGNGLLPGGGPLLTGDPTDTSVAVGPAFVAAWVKHNRQLLSSAPGSHGVRYYALDNEPELWTSTHQDLRYGDRRLIRPELGYDELWERTVAYASAIKQADPEAKILGPVAWGWCAYVSSGRDQCKAGPDRAAHGGQPLLRWYLQQVCSYEKKTGVRLVDYLDVHYYPATEADSRDESSASQRQRLAATRSLYDPEFKDGSWIPEPVALIPRLKAWTEGACPGTGLAITEYRFGENPQGVSAMLANAEAMAIFAREGVAIATYWGALAKGSLLESAFRLYLDYDGSGGSGLGARVLATRSDDPLVLPAYGLATARHLLVYVFNKSDRPRTVRVAGLPPAGPTRRFLATGTTGLTEVPGQGQDVTLPPLAALLLEWPRSGNGQDLQRKP